MQVTIPPELAAYVQARVARGDYANLEELVKDSIRLLEKLDTLAQRKLEELRESVQRAAEQLDRGDGVPFTEDVAEDQAAGARTARGLGAEEIGVKPAELSPEARADLDEIWLHVAADSLEAADRLIDDLRAKCDSLSVLPGGGGRDRSDFVPGARTVPYGNYLIFYRERAGWIEILRIVHGMRPTATARRRRLRSPVGGACGRPKRWPSSPRPWG